MYQSDITIIGAGCVGLALAKLLASKTENLVLLEKNYSFGMETSSRNSEVIHAGIYYPPASLKAELCVKGRRMLYDYLAEKNIKFKKLGKLICAANNDEVTQLHKLLEIGRKNNVEGLELLDTGQIKALEPAILALRAIHSPQTGIFDSHSFMESLLHDAKERGAMVSFNSEVEKIQKAKDGYLVFIKGDSEPLQSRILINAAGLGSSAVASLAGIDVEAQKLKLYFCKGDYFRSRNKIAVKMLVYPVPSRHGLGIHLTPDIAADTRFGPDTKYVDKLVYNVDESSRDAFYESIRNIYPAIDKESLYPDTCGIRPKLEGPNDSFRDFYISEESSKGLKGFINLIGIDSPGLTSSMAIAEYTAALIK